jgi:hypothetical protein
MANLTFPESPVDGQKLLVGNRVFVYNSTLGSWRSARINFLGKPPTPVGDGSITSNIVFSSTANNNSSVIVGNTVYTYSNTTNAWFATRILKQKFAANTLNDGPTLTLSNTNLSFATSNQSIDITYTITDPNYDFTKINLITTTNLTGFNISLFESNNTIRIVSGNSTVSEASLTVTSTDGRIISAATANIEFTI